MYSSWAAACWGAPRAAWPVANEHESALLTTANRGAVTTRARMLSSLIATQRCRIYSTRSDVHGSPVAPPSLLCGQLPRFGRAHGRVEARGTDVKADKGAAPHVAPESVRVVDRYAWIVKTRRNQRSWRRLGETLGLHGGPQAAAVLQKGQAGCHAQGRKRAPRAVGGQLCRRQEADSLSMLAAPCKLISRPLGVA